MQRSVVWFAASAALLGLASARPAPAQTQASSPVKARLSSGVVKLGSQAAIVVSAENVRRAALGALPVVDGLRIGPPPAPSHNTSTVYRNGRVTTSESWVWAIPVVPLRAGDYSIPSMEVEVDGRTFATRPLALTAVADLRGEELGTLSIRASAERVVEGQPFSVDLEFGWDLGINSQIDELNLSLPWWGELFGAVPLEESDRGLKTRRFEVSVNRDETGMVEETGESPVRGRPFRMFRMRRTFLPSRAGELEFPQSFLAFRQVIDPGGGSLFNPRPAKAETYFVSQPAFTVRVDPLPEAGRPLDYSGAVGTFEVRAEADRRDVDAGDSIKLTVEWSGQGNFEFFDLPDLSRLEAFRGFRVYGSTERKERDHRAAVYDIAPVSSEVRSIPPVPLSVYDPAKSAYTIVEGPAIEIRVRALEGAEGLEASGTAAGGGSDIRDIQRDASPRAGLVRIGSGPLLLVMAATVVLWAVLARLRRRSGDPGAPAERHRRRAKKRLARDIHGARDARSQLKALLEFLGARTRECETAWEGRDPRSFFAAVNGAPIERSVDGERAADGALQKNCAPQIARAEVEALARLISDLEREAYGGENRPVEPRDVLAQADRLLEAGL